MINRERSRTAETLSEIIERSSMRLIEIIRRGNISYYGSEDSYDTLFSEPKSFIRNVLLAGDKDMSHMNPDEYRYFHSASIYMLGIACYRNIRQLNIAINNFINSSEENEFLYYWFMTAFIHDLGYGVVKSRQPNIWGTRDRGEIKEKTYNIINNWLLNDFNAVPTELRTNLIRYRDFREWLNSRSCDSNKEFIDHGHFSSAYFLDDRQVKFDQKRRTGQLENLGDGRLRDLHTRLIWSESILDGTQRKICQVIACHNIFFQRPYTNYARVYRRLNLDDLLTYSPLYSYNNYPFYFLMQLTDTVDLFKHYCRYLNDYTKESLESAYDKVLQDVDLEFKNNGIVINFVNFDDEFVKKYWLDIRRERYWLPINVKKIKNRIDITFQ